ncbi:MAG: GNAT family N-acetyltransferase [Bacteroidota bacterium]|nr:GNAT family N-acetyltransferase [Bacteroidota bacterium]MDP4233442.1 GNAT family N-acetyltransferase [Bacteroidota bacterium]MDP4242308.1 GNAT family N-acetyltransferase [Bacteroidota bacterium]MDP4287064.1 GNAT family N-acetyltransferase [Bacteroidota bacterium]
MAILTTSPRLTLRSLEREDIPHSVDMWCDAETMRYMGGPRERTKLLAYIDDLLTHEDATDIHTPNQFWTAIQTHTNEYIGDFGLIQKEVDGAVETELVYLVAKHHWGNGYATEGARALADYAFAVAGLSRLVSLVDPEHIASQRVAEKVGMTFERETVRSNGRTMRIYSILNESV